MNQNNIIEFPNDRNNRLRERLGELYTPEEVARYLKVAPSTVYSWVKIGKIQCHVISQGKRKSTVRFDIEQIQQFIKSRGVA